MPCPKSKENRKRKKRGNPKKQGRGDQGYGYFLPCGLFYFARLFLETSENTLKDMDKIDISRVILNLGMLFLPCKVKGKK